MSELLMRAIKLAEQAEALALQIKHAEPVVIEGQCTVIPDTTERKPLPLVE